jgi:large subunit ribosomal protein L31e|tara:strand:+ start:1705 stop:2259 length:555 start_codon:yes stop_codon:yes gene_type:complete
MAKKEEKPKTVLERAYNVPLRKEFQKVAKWRRAEKAVTGLRKFIAKHIKSENVLLGKYVNKELWKNGIKNPPHHVKVTAQKDDKGKVTVELTELPSEAKREIEKEKGLKKTKEEKEAKKKEEAKKAEEAKKKEEKAPETKQEKAKEEEKKEIKELKKELPKQQVPKPVAAPKQVEQRATAPKGQ